MYNPKENHATFNELWAKYGDETQNETHCRIWFIHAWAIQEKKLKAKNDEVVDSSPQTVLLPGKQRESTLLADQS